jgi:hypothetical protein
MSKQEGAYQCGAVNFTTIVGKMAQKYTKPTAPDEISVAPAIIITYAADSLPLFSCGCRTHQGAHT